MKNFILYVNPLGETWPNPGTNQVDVGQGDGLANELDGAGRQRHEDGPHVLRPARHNGLGGLVFLVTPATSCLRCKVMSSGWMARDAGLTARLFHCFGGMRLMWRLIDLEFHGLRYLAAARLGGARASLLRGKGRCERLDLAKKTGHGRRQAILSPD